MDSAIKFQNDIPDLQIKCLEEYQSIFDIYHKGIFISNMVDCKTRKYSLQERYNGLSTKVKLGQNRFQEMETHYPFYLYVIDTLHQSFAKLKIIQIYINYSDIPNEKLYLIPESLKQLYGYAYYEFSDLEVLPYEASNAVINVNTGNSLYEVRQINSNAPWYVECLEGKLGTYLIDNAPQPDFEDSLGNYPNFCVYRYYLDLPNCKMSYIGMAKDIQHRYDHHKNPSSWNSKNEHNKFLYIAFKNPAIGYDKFQFEILHSNLTEDEAHYWEAKEIQNFNAYFPFGFNVRNEDKYLKQIS